MNSPYVFVGDGTVPVIFKGTINSRKASLYSFHDAYFTEFLVADSNTIGITTKSIKTKSTALGKINKLNESIKFYINDEILIKEMDGSFDSDGILLWNNFLQKFIYTYYYRNKYVIIDKNLNKIKLSKTIDTIGNPILDIAYYSKSKSYKLGSKLQIPVILTTQRQQLFFLIRQTRGIKLKILTQEVSTNWFLANFHVKRTY